MRRLRLIHLAFLALLLNIGFGVAFYLQVASEPLGLVGLIRLVLAPLTPVLLIVLAARVESGKPKAFWQLRTLTILVPIILVILAVTLTAVQLVRIQQLTLAAVIAAMGLLLNRSTLREEFAGERQERPTISGMPSQADRWESDDWADRLEREQTAVHESQRREEYLKKYGQP